MVGTAIVYVNPARPAEHRTPLLKYPAAAARFVHCRVERPKRTHNRRHPTPKADPVNSPAEPSEDMPHSDMPPAGDDTPPADDELSRRLDFLGLTDDDAEKLQALAPRLQAHADEFIRAFYEHLFAFPETAKFLQDPDRVERIKRAQRQHFESLLACRWDDEFAAERRRAGEAHAVLGLQPEYFLGAYNQYVQHCFRFVAGNGRAGGNGISSGDLECLMSLVKAMFLDIGLTLDAYFSHSTRSLQQALDLYWRTNQDLRRFAQLASHDLKTPLATVANRCEEALDEFGDQMPEEARELVSQARAGVFRMSRLIDELLDSTIAANNYDANDLFESRGAVVEAIERVQPVLDQRQIELRVAAEFPRVWGNPVQLREALYNLLSNAAKFIVRQPGRIGVSADEGEDACVFAVVDNGPGIPRDELERIFVPFRRLPMHHALPGSGLGLYFTKTLVEAQGGEVWAESELGQGSTFCIRLRRHPANHRGQPA